MTKSQLIDNLSTVTNVPKQDVASVLDGLTAMAYEYVKADGEFPLPGFGKVVKAFRKERVGRNPATGETINIPAKTVVKFRLTKALKEAVL